MINHNRINRSQQYVLGDTWPTWATWPATRGYHPGELGAAVCDALVERQKINGSEAWQMKSIEATARALQTKVEANKRFQKRKSCNMTTKFLRFAVIALNAP